MRKDIVSEFYKMYLKSVIPDWCDDDLKTDLGFMLGLDKLPPNQVKYYAKYKEKTIRLRASSIVTACHRVARYFGLRYNMRVITHPLAYDGECCILVFNKEIPENFINDNP